MTSRDIYRCIGGIDDALIEEAAEVKRRPRWLPIAALAACAALAIAIPLAVHGLPGFGASSEAPNPAQTPAASEPPAAETPAEMPAAEEPAAAEESAAEAPAEEPAKDHSGGREDGDPIAARILSATLGDLRLGMTSGEVAARIGGPDAYSNSGPVERADGLQEICWFYNTSGSADVLSDVQLTFVGDDLRDGADAELSGIRASSPSAWTLDTGVGIGSTRDEVLAAYPDAELDSDTADGVAADRNWEQFYYRAGDLYLTITLRDEAVASIELGGLNADHDPDEAAEPEADPYTFTPYETLSGDTVTAYTRTETGWEKQTLTGPQAKHLVTCLNISDPEPGETSGDVQLWLVFESGGVAALYGADGADTPGAIYRLEDEAAFTAALEANEDPAGALTRIEQCVFPIAWDMIEKAFTLAPEW